MAEGQKNSYEIETDSPLPDVRPTAMDITQAVMLYGVYHTFRVWDRSGSSFGESELTDCVVLYFSRLLVLIVQIQTGTEQVVVV